MEPAICKKAMSDRKRKFAVNMFVAAALFAIFPVGFAAQSMENRGLAKIATAFLCVWARSRDHQKFFFQINLPISELLRRGTTVGFRWRPKHS